jgi:pyochelin biosynthesis protein PchC
MTDMTELASDHRLWLRRFHPAPHSAHRLVCFPHAGGSATSYFPISAALSPPVEALSVQYPGRQDRRRDACFASIAEVADQLYDVIRFGVQAPLALFGHSMGAIAAFEVARRLEHEAGIVPAALFVSGRRAPSVHRDENVHLRDDAGLVAELRALDGIDPRILADDEILQMVLPVIRSDYRAIETYRYRPGPPLTCPVTALVGREDPRAPLDEVNPWEDHTTGRFELRTFPGGHFYLEEHHRQVAGVVLRQLTGKSSAA